MTLLMNSLLSFTKYYKQSKDLKVYSLVQYRKYFISLAKREEILQDNVENYCPKEQQAASQKSLSIAVIGIPNAGKSTFINNLINHRVCPTSSKVHTTRKANKVIYTTGQTQLIFYDTPGMVTQKEIKKHNLEQSFLSSYRHAIQHSDMIAVVHDISNSWTRRNLHPTVIEGLKSYPKLPSILILNKLDVLKSKRITLELIKRLTNNTLSDFNRQTKTNNDDLRKPQTIVETVRGKFGSWKKIEVGWSNFSEVFLTSSITSSGLQEVHDYLINVAKTKPWKYSSDAFTDEIPENLIVDSVKARLLDFLPQEIPYSLKTSMEYYSVDSNTVYASVQVICPSERIERLICGHMNVRLRQITERVSSDLVETFGKPISFTITTKARREKQ